MDILSQRRAGLLCNLRLIHERGTNKRKSGNYRHRKSKMKGRMSSEGVLPSNVCKNLMPMNSVAWQDILTKGTVHGC